MSPSEEERIGRGDLSARQHALEALRKRLREQVGQELQSDRREDPASLGGGGRDRGDESVATHTSDLNFASADLHLHSLEEVEAALARIRNGSYGVCVDCGEPIAAARLDAQPAAARCIDCQTRFEDDRDERDATPSL